MKKEAIYKYEKEQYGTEPEYLWKRDPNSAVLRHRNRKWYAVFTVEKVKSVIRTLAKMGMNVLMLYTEDTYEVPGEPYFGSYRGRYIKAEIQEMDAYASMFGIELVPCIQTLAHLHNALKWPDKNEIKDSTDVLIVGKEETNLYIY